MKESRRRFLAQGLAAAALLAGAKAQGRTVRIGYSISKTGPYATGAGITTLPNYRLWVEEVNAAGGLKLASGPARIAVVEYDDRSSPEEAIRNIERLITQDKVDFVLPPWGTAMNLAVAPVFARHGYPQVAVTNLSEKTPELVRRWPSYFSFLGLPSQYAEALALLLRNLAAAGKGGRRVAVVHTDDEFGLELSGAFRRAAQKEGLELVYFQSYPQGFSDFQSLLNAVKGRNPDAFVAFSYPAETLALPEAAAVVGFNPAVFFLGVGTAFPVFRQRYGARAEGIMGLGGVAPNQAWRGYLERHQAVTGQEPDRWASQATYASLQALKAAIETAGKVDRFQIVRLLRQETFDTILGPLRLEGNIFRGNWLIGQWQDGEFVALMPERPGAQAPRVPKPAWSR
ncbi:Twin-arginine translocation pathway signal [Thermus sp. CCB_US3_UF1]|uniref:amino acid ABC transporter substrate-binding protein n=1 Tax=Thermus sp. CCB_US3_UF1 TaxID=1111069 RepID=UPI00023895C4|nr:amino acid ABC transporter substrate-binding protein [Thermus sp. CCB_US3_UF1]AEV16339.1 Twin-arginine translocation pathway signal [Thermus sp. CCB_US3_UF1]